MLGMNIKIFYAIIKLYGKNIYNNDFMKNLSKVLNINWIKELQEITIKVGKIPIYPRKLEKYCFYIENGKSQ